MNAQTLLNWGTANMDPNASHEPKQIKPEDLKFFEAMLQSDAEKMKTFVKIFKSNDYSLEEKEAALEELQFFVEQQENAVDLDHSTIDGLVPIIEGLKSEFPGIRSRCGWILATGLQNNPPFQEKVANRNGLEALVTALQTELSQDDRHDLETVGKLVYAISGFLTNNKIAQKGFWSKNGFSALNTILRLDGEDLDQFVKSKEVIEAPSGHLDVPNGKTDSKKTNTKEDNDGKNVVAKINVFDPEEEINQVAEAIRKEKQEKIVTKSEVKKLWTRLCSKVVFLLSKMMTESENFKLAFVKDKNGEIVTSIIRLLDEDDLDLKEKLVSALTNIISSSNPALSNVSKAFLNDARFELISKLNEQKKSISGKDSQEYDPEYLLKDIDQLITMLKA